MSSNLLARPFNIHESSTLFRRWLAISCVTSIAEQKIISELFDQGLRAEHLATLLGDKRTYRKLLTKWLFEGNKLISDLCNSTSKIGFLELYSNEGLSWIDSEDICVVKMLLTVSGGSDDFDANVITLIKELKYPPEDVSTNIIYSQKALALVLSPLFKKGMVFAEMGGIEMFSYEELYKRVRDKFRHLCDKVFVQIQHNLAVHEGTLTFDTQPKKKPRTVTKSTTKLLKNKEFFNRGTLYFKFGYFGRISLCCRSPYDFCVADSRLLGGEESFTCAWIGTLNDLVSVKENLCIGNVRFRNLATIVIFVPIANNVRKTEKWIAQHVFAGKCPLKSENFKWTIKLIEPAQTCSVCVLEKASFVSPCPTAAFSSESELESLHHCINFNPALNIYTPFLTLDSFLRVCYALDVSRSSFMVILGCDMSPHIPMLLCALSDNYVCVSVGLPDFDHQEQIMSGILSNNTDNEYVRMLSAGVMVDGNVLVFNVSESSMSCLVELRSKQPTARFISIGDQTPYRDDHCHQTIDENFSIVKKLGVKTASLLISDFTSITLENASSIIPLFMHIMKANLDVFTDTTMAICVNRPEDSTLHDSMMKHFKVRYVSKSSNLWFHVCNQFDTVATQISTSVAYLRELNAPEDLEFVVFQRHVNGICSNKKVVSDNKVEESFDWGGFDDAGDELFAFNGDVFEDF